MRQVFIYPLVLFLMIRCETLADKKAYSITIFNDSENAINFYASYSYPDTSLSMDTPYLKGTAKKEYGFLDSKKKWEEIIESLPADTLSVFILNTDTVLKYNWNEIRTGYRILKRYDLSLDDLQKMNWTITYP